MGEPAELTWVVQINYTAKNPKDILPAAENTIRIPNPNSKKKLVFDDIAQFTSRFEVHKVILPCGAEKAIAYVLAEADKDDYISDYRGFLRGLRDGMAAFKPAQSDPSRVYEGILHNIATLVRRYEAEGPVVLNKQERIVVDYVCNSVSILGADKSVRAYYETEKMLNASAFWPQSNGRVRLRVF